MSHQIPVVTPYLSSEEQVYFVFAIIPLCVEVFIYGPFNSLIDAQNHAKNKKGTFIVTHPKSEIHHSLRSGFIPLDFIDKCILPPSQLSTYENEIESQKLTPIRCLINNVKRSLIHHFKLF